MIDGKLHSKQRPSRGIRNLNVAASCNDSAEKIAYNYEGYIPTQEQMNNLKWKEVPQIEVVEA